MYRSIGNDMAVREDNIIGIFDLDNTSWSRHTRSYLRRAEQEGQVVTVAEDLPKSFLLTREYGMDRVYLLQYSSRTMASRLEEPREDEIGKPEKKG